MSNSSRFGPQKLILINSGRYDYAEVDFNGAIQLVGDNNIGKTSLIATLQFLYINDLRHMKFGDYKPEDTQRYYFRDEYSYILFQCLTPHGQRVLGWRGVSPIKGGEPERFCFIGAWVLSDFINERGAVRAPEEVSKALALRQYHRLSGAREHAEALIGNWDALDGGLGIISVDAKRFDHFRETLKNLLSLKDIAQEEMKARLMMLAKISPEHEAVRRVKRHWQQTGFSTRGCPSTASQVQSRCGF